jgi:hypothetical protein
MGAALGEKPRRLGVFTHRPADILLLRESMSREVSFSELCISCKGCPGQEGSHFFQLNERISMMTSLEFASQVPLTEGQSSSPMQ